MRQNSLRTSYSLSIIVYIMSDAKVPPPQDVPKSESHAITVQQVDNVSHALAGAGGGLISIALTHVVRPFAAFSG